MLDEKTTRLLRKKYLSKIASTKGRLDKNGQLIEMRLTFEEWCMIWIESGHLPQSPYVISRFNDCGHYEVGNVYIQHNLMNISEANGTDTELDIKINQYCIETGYKRRTVKAMIQRGELVL